MSCSFSADLCRVSIHVREANTVTVSLTADVQVDGVASLSVGVLEAAVQPVVAQVHFGQDEPGSLQAVLGLHVRPVHLPRH